MWCGKRQTSDWQPTAPIARGVVGLSSGLAFAALVSVALVPSAEAKGRSCGVKKFGDVKARVYVDKGKVSCRLATTTLRHADIRNTRKGWTCYRGNSHLEHTPNGIGCERKKGRDVVSAVYVAD